MHTQATHAGRHAQTPKFFFPNPPVLISSSFSCNCKQFPTMSDRTWAIWGSSFPEKNHVGSFPNTISGPYLRRMQSMWRLENLNMDVFTEDYTEVPPLWGRIQCFHTYQVLSILFLVPRMLDWRGNPICKQLKQGTNFAINILVHSSNSLILMRKRPER